MGLSQLNAIIECRPDPKIRNKYLGTITFIDLREHVNVQFTFVTTLVGDNLHVEASRRGLMLFQFHQDQPVEDQLPTNPKERFFRGLIIDLILGGIEGSSKVAGLFYAGAEPSEDDEHALLASMVVYRNELKLSIKKSDLRNYILCALREASY